MARRISMAARSEIAEAVVERYRSGRRSEKKQILDEFVAVTGHHRKHAIRVLSQAKMPRRDGAATRRSTRRYGDRVGEVLVLLWEASDRVCSKRLVAMLPRLLPALELHGRVHIDDALRAQLLAISAATIDRLLADARAGAQAGRRRRAGQGSAVRRSVPIRTFGDWNDPPPGFVEVDFVAHSGPSAAGLFVQTLVLTDIASGWTECVPVVFRDGVLVIEAITKARSLFPFPLRGVDFDNDSVFMNVGVVDWCREQGFEVTRSRAYRKNDQAWVEQKNGAIVRRLVGYGRFEGAAAVTALVRLYSAARLHTNVIQPSFKLKSKKREGARVTKRYHAPEPPAERLLVHSHVADDVKQAIRHIQAGADPVILIDEIRAAQEALGQWVDRKGTTKDVLIAAAKDNTSLASAAQARGGETRTIHRRPYRRRKPIPERPGMVAAYRDQLRTWMDQDPKLSAAAALERLTALAPDVFGPRHLRTIQRAVKTERMAFARQLISEGSERLVTVPPIPMSTNVGLPQNDIASLGNIPR